VRGIAGAVLLLALLATGASAQKRYGAPPPDLAKRLDRLVASYPQALARHDGRTLFFRDGTTMPVSDGRTDKSFEELLAAPDIDDMFVFAYPKGAPAAPPPQDFDPGRVRNEAFFTKVFGDCRGKRAAAPDLVEVVWMPETAPQPLPFNRAAGAARALEKVVAELERLPAPLKADLVPSAGTLACRPIAGTNRLSAHGYATAIDIATKRADYWRWSKGGWRNRVPLEIVAVFERHGFIWGGRWHHFDTMHFEYRPDLF